MLSIRKLRLTHYNRKLVCVFSDTNNFYKSCDPHHFLRLRALLDRSFFIKKSVHFSLATNYYYLLTTPGIDLYRYLYPKQYDFSSIYS